MRAISASAWSVIPTQPRLELLHNCLSQQECITVKTQIVTAILYPLFPSPPPQVGDFQVGAIVQRDHRLLQNSIQRRLLLSDYLPTDFDHTPYLPLD
ncbi:hypothetical protein [Coleofasciculus sp. E2-BRE-01]|uniref:hypothetical protein n=1 Tax=Coleofasciculus sp. E2-BRE-01 TaxID=3069524 RepID=UPI003302A2E0